MTLEDFSFFLLLVVFAQFYFMRKFYLQVKVLRLEFSMFIRDVSIQIDEIATSAKEVISEQVKTIHPSISMRDAEDYVPDVVRNAAKEYWDNVEKVQKVLLRNGLSSLTRSDAKFGLSDSLK